MATLNLIDVCKNHGQQMILDKVNLAIASGEFVAVVGPSGCGKSTLLRLVAGLDEIHSGKILLDDRCIDSLPPARRDMAMVFQNYALYPHMTVFDNMAYGLKMRGMKPALIREKVAEVATMLQLTDYLQRKPQALSGGQRQRVAMGRAIVRRPAVFLFDEPLSNLDAKLRTEMRHEIRKLHQQLNTTSIYVTHDQTEAMTMASRVMVLNKGRVEQIDSPSQLYSQPASLFVASFTGHYPINFLAADYDKKTGIVTTPMGFKLPGLAIAHPTGQELILGIRPEHFKVVPQNTESALLFKVEWVDDMGADKLIQLVSSGDGGKLVVRTSASTEIVGNQLALDACISKANLFDKVTGFRLGGWNG